MNKKKILNDPVYGFITIPNDLVFDIIEHPYFQRLRRIKQLGLTDLVYPGAHHTRFHHAIGATYLMQKTLDTLRSKGVMIFDAEYEAALVAILLHDVGHGPFSHTLEFSLFKGVHHEQISLWIFDRLNKEFGGRLELAKQIFTGKYHRKFLHQLVSSQLDVDRLDYLKRDSFFTGVYEGTIGAERIIKMLNVHNDELVVEEKGIYSIENFVSARRLMYWQVYLHKTSVAAEAMLISLIKRAKKLTQAGKTIPATPALSIFLERDITRQEFLDDPDLLGIFTMMDDMDIWGSIKMWQSHEDPVLSTLSHDLLTRKLFKIKLSNEKFESSVIDRIQNLIVEKGFNQSESKYFIQKDSISNSAYIPKGGSINILMKSGEIIDVAQASDLPNIKVMSKIVKKYYLCYPRNLKLPADIFES
ncbi:MAG: phosphohydrolase [Flammeovirgaceae bacterium]|nr:phosphohydrolase [Flammeovirgaceae bacterium]MBR10649.1 phosphohydrolase [Rickettsiales bacterium]